MIRSSVRKVYTKCNQLVRPAREREALHSLLGRADHLASLDYKIYWLEELMFWIRTSSPHAHAFDASTGQLHNVRIRFLLHLLDRNPEWKSKVAKTLRSLAIETSARSLFTDVGLGQYKGFLSEIFTVIFSKWLPRLPQDNELSQVFVRIFETKDDSTWVSHIPNSLMGQIVALVRQSDPEQSAFSGWYTDLLDSLLILGSRVGAVGTSSLIISRLKISEIEHLGFIRLNYQLVRLVEAQHNKEPLQEFVNTCNAEIQKCRANLRKVYSSLEESGVSVGLVYTLENLTKTLDRIELLLTLLLPASDETPNLLIGFLSYLVRERLEQSTLSHLIKTNLHLLSSKVVERAGATGEHYIARTREEYVKMIKCGLGGGVVMVGTTLVKFWLTALKAAPFFESLFYSINYSFSFALLQLMGFTLATKQPSATASALAVKLRNLQAEGEIREFVDEICLMTRTQFAALVGNLLLLIPTGFLLDFILFAIFKSHFISKDTARYVLHSLDPIHSVTIFAAALTGVWLWLSSLAAGWLENWIVYHRIRDIVAQNRRLNQVFGAEIAAKIGDWILNNATLIGGNVSLGFLLGTTATFGHFTGLPIDVRHVTLSSASLVFALGALIGDGLTWKEILLPCIGVLCVGILNFAVGYSMAFLVAVRARNVEWDGVRRLLRAVKVRLRHKPREFFIP